MPGCASASGSPVRPGWLASRSIAHRNAASVLPEPVGAEMRTCSPEEIAGQASAWAAVGAANAPRNHSRVRGENCSRGTPGQRSAAARSALADAVSTAPRQLAFARVPANQPDAAVTVQANLPRGTYTLECTL